MLRNIPFIRPSLVPSQFYDKKLDKTTNFIQNTRLINCYGSYEFYQLARKVGRSSFWWRMFVSESKATELRAFLSPSKQL